MADINALYQQLFGRQADPAGEQYWQNTGLQGDALQNSMIAGAQGADLQAYQKANQPLLGAQPTTPSIIDPSPTINDPYINLSRSGISSLPAASTSAASPGFTTEQVAAYIRDQNLNPEQAQKAANALGITSTQLSSAQSLLKSGNLSGVDAASQAYAKQVAANPNVVSSNLSYYNPTTNTGSAVEIANAYQQLFGRAPDTAGSQYWAGTGLTGQALLDAMVGGAKGADIGAYYKTGDTDLSTELTTQAIRDYVTANENDPYAIYTAAQKYKVDPATISAVMGQTEEQTANLLRGYQNALNVEQEYKDIGRALTGDQAIDKEGFNYWYNQLQSGAIKPEDFEKTFLGGAVETVKKGGIDEDVSAKTFVESLAKGYNVDNLASIVNPLNVYEEFRAKELTPEEVLKKNPQMTMTDFENYFAQVPDLYSKNVDKTITDVLGADAVSAFTPEQKQTLVNNLVSGDATREDVAKSFQESGANKKQEASRIASIYANAFGGTTEDAKALAAKLLGTTYSGTGTVSNDVYNTAKEAFDKSLNSETDAQAGISTLVKKAANTEGAENQQFFKDNPDLLTVYKDIGETKSFNNAGTGGQYGYYQGIPVLKASEVDEVFDKMGTDYIQGNAPDKLDNDIGWDTGSLSAIESRGAAALGVRKQLGYTDPETNQEYPATYTGDMNKLAAQLGVDPTKYKDTYKTVKVIDPETGVETTQQVIDKRAEDQLYDALNEKAKDFYFIAGKTGTGKTNSQGETSAFARDDVSGNHAAVLYKKEGDKLIPIPQTLKYYNGEMELKKGSWFSDTFGGLASIPGIAELSLLIPGVGPGAYAAIKAAQTAALGGEFKDIAKSGALAFAGAKYLPQVTSGISEGLSGAGITNTIANKALTTGLTSAGVATLTGKDIGNAGLTGLITGGAGAALSPQIKDLATSLDIPSQYHSLFANTLTQLAPTILTGGKIDPTKLLMSYAMSKAKDAAKTTAKGTA